MRGEIENINLYKLNKMETTYLKLLNKYTKKTIAVVKVMEGKELHCYGNQIEFAEDENIGETVKWHKEDLNYIDSTKAEFDTFFIEVVSEINKLSKV